MGVFVKGVGRVLLFVLVLSLFSGVVSADIDTGSFGTQTCNSDLTGIETTYGSYNLFNIFTDWVQGGYEDTSLISLQQLETKLLASFDERIFNYFDGTNACLKTSFGYTTDAKTQSDSATTPRVVSFYDFIYVLEGGKYTFDSRIVADLGRTDSGTCDAKLAYNIYKLYSFEGNENNVYTYNGFNLDKFSNSENLQTIRLSASFLNLYAEEDNHDGDASESKTIEVDLQPGIYILFGIFSQDGDSLYDGTNSFCKSYTSKIFGDSIWKNVQDKKLGIYTHLLTSQNFSDNYNIKLEKHFCEANGYAWSDDAESGHRCCFNNELGSAVTGTNEDGEGAIFVCTLESSKYIWKEASPEDFCDLNPTQCDSEVGIFQGDIQNIFSIPDGSDGCCGDDDSSCITDVTSCSDIDDATSCEAAGCTYEFKFKGTTTKNCNDATFRTNYPQLCKGTLQCLGSDSTKLFNCGNSPTSLTDNLCTEDLENCHPDSTCDEISVGQECSKYTGNGEDEITNAECTSMFGGTTTYSLIKKNTNWNSCIFDGPYQVGEGCYCTDCGTSWSINDLCKYWGGNNWDTTNNKCTIAGRFKCTTDPKLKMFFGTYTFYEPIDDACNLLPIVYTEEEKNIILEDTGCVVDVSSGCSGNLNSKYCNNFKTIDVCDTNVCTWNDFFANDLGFVDSNNRFLCAKDYYYNSVSQISFISIDQNPSNLDWRWWDAVALGNEYKIHSINTIDFVNNGENWFYCSADGTLDNLDEGLIPNSGATPVDDGEHLDEPDNYDVGLKCYSFLNDLITLDRSQSSPLDVFGFDDAEFFLPRCDIDSNLDDYYDYPCCEPNTYVEFSDDRINFDECMQGCYLDEINNLEDYFNYDDNSLIELYCTYFPTTPQCIEFDLGGTGTGGLEAGLFDTEFCDDRTGECYGNSLENENICKNITYKNINNNNIGFALPCERKDDYFSYCKTPRYDDINIEYVGAGDVQSNSADPYLDSCCLLSYNYEINLDEEQDQITEQDVCEYVSLALLNQDMCYAIGGDYATQQDIFNGAECVLGYSVETNDGGRCCISGDWEFDYLSAAYYEFSRPESFICYNHNDEIRFGECCNDFVTCKNSMDDSLFGKGSHISFGANYGAWYRLGGVLQTVQNYDKYNVNNSIRNYAKQFEVEVGNYNPIEIDFDSEKSDRNPQDFSSFDFLEFDVMFSSRDNLGDIILVNEDNSKCNYGPLLNSLIHGETPLRWRHASVNLSLGNCEDEDGTSIVKSVFFSKNITKLQISISNSVENTFRVYVDSFYLSNDDEGETNTPNAYCTGPFFEWITNLDGPTQDNAYFIINNNPPPTFQSTETQEGYGKYKYTCDSQASFGWTGLACCGDDTKVPLVDMEYNITYVDPIHKPIYHNSEYYNDTKSGCFHGNIVYNGETVAAALFADKDSEYNFENLIFYGGQFYACNENEFYDLRVSYGNDFFNSVKLVTETKQEYSVIGNFVCLPDNKWTHKSMLDKSRLLASKLYDLTLDNDDQYNFKLYCDNLNNVMDDDLTDDEFELNDLIENICTLNLDYGDENRTVIGLSFNTKGNVKNLKEFMGKLTAAEALGLFKYLHNLELIDINDPSLSTNKCYDLVSGSTEQTEFFTACDNLGDLYMSYNPDFNILFLTIDGNNFRPTTEFGLMFNTGSFSDYVSDLWTEIKKWFSGWFSDQDPTSSPTTQTIIPYPEKEAIYNKFYLEKKGDQRINAFYFDHTDRVKIYAYDYINFTTQNIAKIFERYYSEYDEITGTITIPTSNYLEQEIQLHMINYNTSDGGLHQIVTIVNPKQTYPSFELPFKWNLYTTGLNINK
ncbi:MAG: hypothetical protein AB7V77_05535 [Candidatus Woesearchaeota archaeon]